jgi:RNA polymerase sigma-70 factor (ECF subfamily)
MSLSAFHATRWTLVRQAGLRSDVGRTALSELCGIYYEPVFHFIRARAANEDLARDLTHGFFEELLMRESVGSPDPEQGRFRSWLLGAVKHFLARHHAQARAAKRGGGAEHVELEEAAEYLTGSEPPVTFDRDWALALIRRALTSLESELVAAGKGHHLQILQPWLDGGSPGPAREAAAALGLTENAFNVSVHRLRQRFRLLVRAEVAATTTTPAETDEEFRHLVDILTAEG